MAKYRAIPPLTPEQEERFWAKVDKQSSSNGCWLWTSAILPNGYGRVTINRRGYYAHRVAYTITVGPIPDGLHLDHVKARGCVNTHCCNPAHLEPVTPLENNRRIGKAEWTHCKRGHEYTPENTRVTGTGRTCKACLRLTNQRAYQRRRLADGVIWNPPPDPNVRPNSLKTHCPRGHEYTPENTYVQVKPNGSVCRSCRTCVSQRDRLRKAKIREARKVQS